jgi:anti-sigma regulatory factor (Ser/Thr protein kinase)
MATDDTLSSARTQRRARRTNDAPHAVGRRTTGSRSEPAALDLGFDSRGLAGVRATVARWAALLDGGRAVDDLLLVVNELCGNAIRHGGGRGRLRLWIDGYRVMCRVTDSGPGMPQPEVQGLDRPASSVVGGRGLWIVRRLADLRIDTGPSGTTALATLSLG